MNRVLVLIALMLCTTACDPDFVGVNDTDYGAGSAGVSGSLLAIGDSYFDWDEPSIPEVAAEQLGIDVQNNAIGGTQFLRGPEAIPDQYEEGDWRWLLMSAGGNDMGACGCSSACDEVLDRIVSADGSSGEAVDFVEEVLDQDVRVAWLGYPDLPEDPEGFEGCEDELVDMRARLGAMGARIEGFLFIDGEDAIEGERLDYFAEDRVHPSEEGAIALGELVADAIAGAD